MNAGKYNKRISIYKTTTVKNPNGFMESQKELVLKPYANVKTTIGMTLIANNTDFEQAYTRFTIRYPRNIEIDRDMTIEYNGKEYTIEYLNNIDEADVELEIQAKEVTH